MNYHYKYLKYKFKYLNLKGGSTPTKEQLPQTPNQPVKLPENITASSEYTPKKNNCNTILQKLKEEIDKDEYITNVIIINNSIEFIKNRITYLILCESNDKHHYLKLLLKNDYLNYNTSKINKKNKYVICKISMHDGQSSVIDTKTGIHAQTNLNKRSVNNSNLLFENKHYIFDNNFKTFNEISRIFCGLFMDMMNNDRNTTNFFQKLDLVYISKRLF